MPCLVWESPEGRVVHDLDRAVLVIGRDTVSDIVVLEPAVSRRHALVQIAGDSVTVTDLGSSSGTRINGAKLTPDLPSSLQADDIIQIGRVVLTYHVVPPPPAPLRLDTDTTARAPKPARAASPVVRSSPLPRVSPPPRISPPPRTPPRVDPRRADAVAPGGPPWKWIAFGAAFLTVGMAGALTAVVMGRGDKVVERPVTVSRSKVEFDPGVVAPEPKTERKSVPEATPEKEPERDESRAPDGELPPRGFVSVTDFPDLIEVNGDLHYPVSIVTWNGSRVEAVGADGRTYLIRQADVTKSEDRADLARRAARARQQLDPDDADAQLELARWCFRRYVQRETRLLAKRVLELRPGDAEATELLRMTE